MSPVVVPPPHFERFERVRIVGDSPRLTKTRGELGVVVCHDSSYVLRAPEEAARWQYVVHLPSRQRWPTLSEFELEGTGEIESSVSHLAVRPEISFDLDASPSPLPFMEGCYRLPGQFWQVIVVVRRDRDEVRIKPCEWPRPTAWELPATGVVIEFPRSRELTRDAILQLLSQHVGDMNWTEVAGPDSMSLR